MMAALVTLWVVVMVFVYTAIESDLSPSEVCTLAVLWPVWLLVAAVIGIPKIIARITERTKSPPLERKGTDT